MEDDDPRTAVQEALQGFAHEGEVVTRWCVAMEVVGPSGAGLVHRAGGGHEGRESPTIWTAIGMLRSSQITAERQLLDDTRDP